MSPAVKPVTLSSKVTVTGIGDVLVGSGAAEDIDTDGGVGSSPRDGVVRARRGAAVVADASSAAPAGIDATTVPFVVMPVTATV